MDASHARPTGPAAEPPARAALPWLLLVAGAILPSVAVLAAGRSLVWGDSAALFAPIRPLVVESLRELRLPLWNPHEAFGIPLHAQMIHSALHPVSVVAAWLAPGAGVDLLLVANVAVAAAGAACVARALGVGSSGALVAGWAYGLSGYVLGIGAVIQYQYASATAPWAVAALLRAGRPGWAGAGPAALGVGALHLAGDPQWTLAAVALGTLLAAHAGGIAGAGRALLGIALGTLVGAVQLLPSWTFVAESERAGGLSEADRVQWALSPWRLAELVAPGFFAGRASEHLRAPVFLWLGGPTQSRLLRPFAPGIFVGGATLVLAAVGVASARAGKLLCGAALVAAWLALGHHAGAQQLLAGVPIWGAFRYSEKLVGPLTLCLAVLAGLGADELQRAPRPRAGRTALALAAAAALVAAGLALGSAGTAEDGAWGEAARALGLGLVHAAVALGVLGLVLVRGARRGGAAGPALAALTLAAGWAAAPYVLHAGARAIMDAGALAALRADGPTPRVATPLLDPPFPNPLGLGPADLDVAARSRYGAAPFNVPWRFDQVDVYTGLTPRRVIAFAERLGPDVWTALRRFGLTHVVLRPPADEPAARLAAEAARGSTPVLSSPEWSYSVVAVPHRPWARFAARAVPAPSEAAALEALAGFDLAGIDATVVEGGAPPTAPGRVLAAERGRERVLVDAEASGPALLVVSDSFWPGWTATVDGQPAPILRADVLVRGIPFPPGRHVVELRYAPPEARLGAWLSALGIGAAIALAVLARRSGRRRAA